MKTKKINLLKVIITGLLVFSIILTVALLTVIFIIGADVINVSALALSTFNVCCIVNKRWELKEEEEWNEEAVGNK